MTGKIFRHLVDRFRGTCASTNRSLVVAVAVGVVLRTLRYLTVGPLYSDEAMLYVNLHRTVPDLVLRQLDYFQTAPPLFLVLEKLAVLCLGSSEYALRLVPFLAAVVALFAFAALARLALRGWAVPFAVLLFALSPYLINYGAAAKQYSTDVLAQVLLLTATLRAFEHTPSARELRDLGLAGALLAGLSQPIVLTLPVLSALVVIRQVRSRWLEPRGLGLLLGLWISAALLIGLGSVVLFSSTARFMRAYWSEAFLPFPPDFEVYARAVALFFRHPGGLLVPLTGLLAFVVGLRYYSSERWKMCVVVAPLLGLFGAAAAGLYPFVPLGDGPGAGRLLVFGLPSAMLLVGAGVCGLVAHRSRVVRLSGAVLGGLVAVQLGYGTSRPFPRYGDIRPRFEYVAEHRKPGDQLVVPPALLPLADYYRAAFGLDTVPIVPDGRAARFSPGRRWYLYVGDTTAASLRHSGVRIVSWHRIGNDAVLYYERTD